MASPGTPGTEVELKLRVDDLAALMRICVAAGALPSSTATQRNQYLDTSAKTLDAARFVLRLREESTATSRVFFLTAKGPAIKSKDGMLTQVPEEEIQLADDEASAVRAGRADPLALLLAHDATPARADLVGRMRAAVGDAIVGLAGEFINERTRLSVAFPEGFSGVLELDRVVFPGNQIHHEVEFEVPAGVDVDVAQRAFQALFARASVTGRPAPGKASRFFKALRGEVLP
jgi:uncharacterized protein YjbK